MKLQVINLQSKNQLALIEFLLAPSVGALIILISVQNREVWR